VRLAKIVDGAPTTPVDGASVLRVMTLGVKCGDEVLVTVEGESEEETSAKLQEIVESNDH
jgi:phosphocarrier protein